MNSQLECCQSQLRAHVVLCFIPVPCEATGQTADAYYARNYVY